MTTIKVWKRLDTYFIDLVKDGDLVEVYRSKDPKQVRFHLDRLKRVTGFSVSLCNVNV